MSLMAVLVGSDQSQLEIAEDYRNQIIRLETVQVLQCGHYRCWGTSLIVIESVTCRASHLLSWSLARIGQK